jgi:GNAT superfamily N-acetyltransferase
MSTSFEAHAGAGWPVGIIEHAEIAPTARLLAAAFHDNPCYAFMHPRVVQRRADLVAFFERNLRWREPLQLTFVMRDAGGEVVATGTLEPPGGGVHRPSRELLLHWVWPTLRRQGLHTMVRTALVDRAFAREQRLVAGRPDYWYVHAVAVRPDLQGRALGSAIMTRLMRELGARNALGTLPVVLATQRQANLAFYARLGFRVRHQAFIGRTLRSPGFLSWFMRFEP